MTTLERQAITALSTATIGGRTYTNRFVRAMAASPDSLELSPRQRAFLWANVWRYRRQLPADLVGIANSQVAEATAQIPPGEVEIPLNGIQRQQIRRIEAREIVGAILPKMIRIVGRKDRDFVTDLAYRFARGMNPIVSVDELERLKVIEKDLSYEE